ncbi:winged helix-turn-helix transcriptional regulator [Larkinella sp. VNQ87]|uniref:winged helix-turn-helix transcriptional regulator n=1 Tax=Larkinella sp. VNQ87 TaxID=3400921 RepID=UPI003C1230CC
MTEHTLESCSRSRRAIQDTLEIIHGKWKLPILITLESRPFRFKELAREIGITPRMLSKELQELELNQLVKRTVLETRPISVEYAITDYGLTFKEVLEAMRNWGMKHRRRIIQDGE